MDATGLVSLARFGTGIDAYRTINAREGLNASGVLTANSGVFLNNLISTPSLSGVLSTNGQLTFERLSDTSLNFVYRGNDGATRRTSVPISGALLNKTGDVLTGGIGITEIINMPTGAVQTIFLASGNHQTLNLASGTGPVATTLSVPSASAVGSIIVIQGLTVRNVTWASSSGSVIWLGEEPNWSTDGVNTSRIVAWRWNGSDMRLAASESSL